MNRVFITLAAVGMSAATSLSFAVPVFSPTGSSLTYGSISQSQTILSATNNPAGAATMLEKGDGWFGFGLLSSVGVGYEVGPMDNLTDRIDKFQKDIDKKNLSIDDANQIIKDTDAFLVELGKSGYASVQTALHVPLFPLVFTSKNTLGGSLTFDMTASMKAKLSVLDRPLKFNSTTEQVETGTAFYVKTGAVAEGSIGYSKPLIYGFNGTLYGGIKANYYQMGLRKALAAVAIADDAESVLRDEFNKTPKIQDGYGLDLGLMWMADNYRLGASFKNLNSPSFNYEVVGDGCDQQTGAARDNCYSSQTFANEIDLTEKYVMNANISLEGAVFSHSRNWFLAAAADTSPVNDPLGNQHQWVSLSTGYATSSWIVPGFRLGYRKNMAGTEQSYATFGLNLFKIVNFDAAYGLESIEIDGTRYPRSAMANLGLEFLF